MFWRGKGKKKKESTCDDTCRMRSIFLAKTLVAMPFSSEYLDKPDRSPPIMASTVAFALSSPIIIPHGYLPPICTYLYIASNDCLEYFATTSWVMMDPTNFGFGLFRQYKL